MTETAHIIAAEMHLRRQPRKIIDGFYGDSFTVCCIEAMLHSMYAEDNSVSDKTSEDLRRTVNIEVSRANYEGFYTGGMPMHVAEALLWMRRDGFAHTDASMKDEVVTEEVLARLELLENVISYPSGIPYFKAGITEISFVRRCVDEGIDTEMALAMLNEQAA